MYDHYTLLKLAEMRHKGDLEAAKHWRQVQEAAVAAYWQQAQKVAPADHRAPRIHRRWLARLGAWLESLGCALQARDPDMPASAAGTACAD
jgi:hypothetical protein